MAVEDEEMLLKRYKGEDLLTTWLGWWSSEHLPGFWLDGSIRAVRECAWRNEDFYFVFLIQGFAM